MQLIDSILLAYDFSDASDRALGEALALAAKFDAKLSIVHVNDHQVATIYGMPIGKASEEKLARKIEKRVKELGGTRHIHTIDVFTGYPYFFIVAKAQTLPADLVIVGSHGRTGLKRILLGSIAEKVARLCPVPVLVHRREKPTVPKKILVPIDHSELSEEAIPYAQVYAERIGAQVQLIHVVAVSTFASKFHYAGLLNESVKNEEERLESFNKKYRLKLSPLVLQGPVTATIADACKNDPDIDLIIMSTHGRSGLKHLLIGSQAESIVRYAPCDVLTMRPEAIRPELHKRIEEDVRKVREAIAKTNRTTDTIPVPKQSGIG